MMPGKISAVLFLFSFAMLCSLAAATASHVMLIEAEDASLVTLEGDWQVIEADGGVVAVRADAAGSTLSTRFFGVEFSLIAQVNSDALLGVSIDGGGMNTLKIEKTGGYEQVRLVEGLDNRYHRLRVTLLSGNLSVDKLLMGSPTDIPEIRPVVEEDYYYRASYNRPWMLQDSKGTYWLSFEVQSLSYPGDIYVTRSSDGIHWAKPAPAVVSTYHDYDSSMVLDDAGEFWMVFTRVEPVKGSRANQLYYTHSSDGIHWKTPQRVNLPQSNAYYPYLYYDNGSFLLLYASSSVEDGEFHDNIYLVKTSALDNLSEPLRLTDNSMDSSYYPTLIKDEEGEFWLYFVSPLLMNESVFANHNDVFVIHSRDLKQWSRPLLVTDGNKSIAYNYIHPAYHNGSYYLSIMSSQSGVEDAYIMRSEDGLYFTPPQRVVEHDDRRIIDYKSLFVDSKGVMWMAYSHVMGDGSRAVFAVNSSDGIHWGTPARITPPSNILGELWLESEPMPESVRSLLAEMKKGSEQEMAKSQEGGGVPKTSFTTLLPAVILMLIAGVLKRRRT